MNRTGKKASDKVGARVYARVMIRTNVKSEEWDKQF